MADIDNNQNGQDIFARTWGGSTKWKTGVPASRRFDFNDGLDPIRALEIPKTSFAEPPRHLELDKPLPKLPEESSTSPTKSEQISEPTSRASSTQASASPISTISSILRLGKRKAVSQKRSKKGAAGSKQERLAVAQAPEIKARPPNYVDRGTQTTNDLLPTKGGQRYFLNLPTGNHPQDPRTPSAVLESKPSLWSPKAFLSTTGPTDYFSAVAPSRSALSSRSSSQESDLSSKTQRRIHLEIGQQTKPMRSHIDSSQGTEDSTGSSASRYSKRPVVQRNANSEPTSGAIDDLLDDKKSILKPQVVVDGSRAQLRFDASPEEGMLKRPMPFPFQRYPSFAGRDRSARHQDPSSRSSSRDGRSPRQRSSTSERHTSKSVSPHSSSLRREFLLVPEGELTTSSTAESGDYFHVRQGPPSPAVTPVDEHIPDHFPSSPLCPRNPKHPSRGLGKCPAHGWNSSISSDIGNLNISKSETSKIGQGSGSKRYEPPAGFHDGPAFPHVEVPRHSADSPECPANQYPRGTCLYHERWVKFDSMDSIPRIPIQ